MLKEARYISEPMMMAISSMCRIVKSCWKISPIKCGIFLALSWMSICCLKKIKIAFHYTSTSQEAGTWEIKSMTVSGERLPSDISAPSTGKAAFDPSEPYETYTIDGRKTTNADHDGVTIIRQGGNTWKVAPRK